MPKHYTSHGSGNFKLQDFLCIGENVVFEEGVLVFHPETISMRSNIYVGHQAILKGYYKNQMTIGDNTWIGQQVFIHSAGGVGIGNNVGIGPGVKILTSVHKEEGISKPILASSLEYSRVVIEDDCDLGVNSVILPGVTLGKGTQVGAGAVVTRSFPSYSVVAGVPAKLIKTRN